MFGQAFQVRLQMRLNLTLCLHHKAKADPVTDRRSGRADGIAADIPEWIQQGRRRIQLAQAICAPAQMVLLLLGGLQ